MRQDLTDVTLIVDRSGSMASCQHEAQGGINAFIKSQKDNRNGEVIFSLLQFDTEHEYVFNGVQIDHVGEYRLEPRGMTALLDAVGKTITETGVRLEKTQEDARPGLVIIAIVTDGQENSSGEFDKATIKEMIKRQQETYNWQFTFLGANQDAFAEAGAMGIHAAGIANFSTAATRDAYNNLTANVNRMRWSASVGAEVKCGYTDEERKRMAK